MKLVGIGFCRNGKLYPNNLKVLVDAPAAAEKSIEESVLCFLESGSYVNLVGI